MTELGLTQKEVDEVERTWGIVSQNLRLHGINLFMALFTEYPAYKGYFKRFEGIATEDLPKTAALKAHASTFMHGMSSFIDSLDDKETLVRVIHDAVGRHHKRKIGAEQFKNTLNLVLPYLTKALGSELTEDGASGWKKILDTLSAVIEDESKRLATESCNLQT